MVENQINYGASGVSSLFQQKLHFKLRCIEKYIQKAFTFKDNLTTQEVKNISKKLHIKEIGKKSGVRLLEEIKFISKLYSAGQGPCHNYVQQR